MRIDHTPTYSYTPAARAQRARPKSACTRPSTRSSDHTHACAHTALSRAHTQISRRTAVAQLFSLSLHDARAHLQTSGRPAVGADPRLLLCAPGPVSNTPENTTNSSISAHCSTGATLSASNAPLRSTTRATPRQSIEREKRFFTAMLKRTERHGRCSRLGNTPHTNVSSTRSGKHTLAPQHTHMFQCNLIGRSAGATERTDRETDVCSGPILSSRNRAENQFLCSFIRVPCRRARPLIPRRGPWRSSSAQSDDSERGFR